MRFTLDLPPARLSLISLGCIAASILLATLALVWLTPITGLVCFFIGTPLLVAGLGGYVIAMLREVSGGGVGR